MPALPQHIRRRGFSVTELLVVIAIIAILVTLLLVALGGAQRKARSLRTTALMTELAKACDTFQMEHGRYPGAVPVDAISDTPPVSTMELALLELMGGMRVFHPTLAQDPTGDYDNFGGTVVPLENDWDVKIDLTVLGDGPVINGKPYAPYFTPNPRDLARTVGQAYVGAVDVPDLIDPWGQPIMMMRRARPNGPLVGAAGDFAQFSSAGILPYLESTGLGEASLDQTSMSILNLVSGTPSREDTLAQLIRTPAFGAADAPQDGTSRGAIALFSAGPDGVYFADDDGPGTSAAPITDIVTDPATNDPKALEEYDDIRLFTGG